MATEKSGSAQPKRQQQHQEIVKQVSSSDRSELTDDEEVFSNDKIESPQQPVEGATQQPEPAA